MPLHFLPSPRHLIKALHIPRKPSISAPISQTAQDIVDDAPPQRPIHAHPGTLSPVSFCSDVHGEWAKLQQLGANTSARIVVLAGDIGNLSSTSCLGRDGDFETLRSNIRSLLAAPHVETVLMVPGNHNFYGSSISSALARGRELESEFSGRFHSLDKRSVRVSGTRFIGLPLFSHITSAEAAARVQDWAYIENWDWEKHNEEHNAQVAWLRQELMSVRSEPTVIVSHWPPCGKGTMHPRFRGGVDETYFASQILYKMQDLPGWSGVRCWIVGHTHYAFDLSVRELGLDEEKTHKGFRLVSNPVQTDPRNRWQFQPLATV